MGRGAELEKQQVSLDDAERFAIDDIGQMAELEEKRRLHLESVQLELLYGALNSELVDAAKLEALDSSQLASALDREELAEASARTLRAAVCQLSAQTPAIIRQRSTNSYHDERGLPEQHLHGLIRSLFAAWGLAEPVDDRVVRTMPGGKLHIISEENPERCLCGEPIHVDDVRGYRYGYLRIAPALACADCSVLALQRPESSEDREALLALPDDPVVSVEAEAQLVAEASDWLKTRLLEQLRNGETADAALDLIQELNRYLYEQVALLAAESFRAQPLPERFWRLFNLPSAVAGPPESSASYLCTLIRDAVEQRYDRFGEPSLQRPPRWPRKDALAKTLAAVFVHRDMEVTRLRLAASIVREHFPQAIPEIRAQLFALEDSDNKALLLRELAQKPRGR